MTLSLCMVVRDESEALPRFLAAVDGCWDELCVVDTGSTDGTVALLREAGAKVVHRPWDDDFAAARNASLALATGAWVLVLDPDELPPPGFAAELRAALEDDGLGALGVPFRNLLHGGHHRDCTLLRVFRREGATYEHRIHEDVGASVQAALLGSGRRRGTLNSRVVHEGYLRARAEARDKRSRDRRILTEAIAEAPDDLYLRFKLLEQARFWEDRELLAAAATDTVRALADGGPLARSLPVAPWGGELLTMLAAGLASDGAEELALLDSWADEARPGPALALRRGELLEELGRLEEAVEAFGACLEMPDDGTLQRTTSRPRMGLVRVALLRGRLDEAAHHCAAALRSAPDDPEAKLAAGFLGLDEPAPRGAVPRSSRRRDPRLSRASS
jgi:hypothetical protein